MQKLLEILKNWPKSFIFSADLSVVLSKSYHSIHSLLKTCVKKGYLIRLKRDFYLISDKIKEQKPDAFEIAMMLYGPSYVSLESSLSYHGWIPEAVPSISLATSKRSKTIDTPIGLFIYYHVPIESFHLGISSIKTNSSNVFIAEPYKAIADYIYVKKGSWKNVFEFCDDLRIDLENIQYSDHLLLKTLQEKYPNQRTKKELKKIYKKIS